MPDRRFRSFHHWLPFLLIAAGLAALPLFLVLDRGASTDIANIKEAGKLRVLTFNGPTTYYRTAGSPSGFEYDLVSAFAEHLGVRLEVVTVDAPASVFPRLRRGDAHLAAASLKFTEARNQIVRFSTPYQTIRTEVVYRRGDARPRDFEDLVGRDITVPAGSAHAQLLSAKKTKLPGLTWSETSSRTVEDLLIDVWEGDTEITLAASNLLAIVRQHHPELRVAFTIERSDRLAWAFRRNTDDSLVRAANRFIEGMRDNGELERLIDRYYGAATKFDYVNVKTFRRKINSVLPRWEPLFKEAGAEYDLDWRLLAAQSYQESYWKPGAESATGVQGLMQLTRDTAEFLDVKDRTDPRQSILGGARYLRSLHDRIDPDVPEPDRTWFALAAYNVGLGHLLDARALARRLDKDADKWTDVRSTLALLSDPEWHEKTKHGRARGYEAVAYVNRIRSFYDILTEIKSDPLEREELRIVLPAL